MPSKRAPVQPVILSANVSAAAPEASPTKSRKTTSSNSAPSTAPPPCAAIYSAAIEGGIRRAASSPSVTAGFRCPPETGWNMYTIRAYATPVAAAIPSRPRPPSLTLLLTMIAAPAKKTKPRTPIASAAILRATPVISSVVSGTHVQSTSRVPQ